MEPRCPTLEARAGQRLLPPLPARLAPGWQSSPLRTSGAYTRSSGEGTGELDLRRPSRQRLAHCESLLEGRVVRPERPPGRARVEGLRAFVRSRAADELWRSRR